MQDYKLLPIYSGLAKAAYRSSNAGVKETEQEWSRRIELGELVGSETFAGGATRGFVTELDNRFCVTFRGTDTDDFSNIWTDLCATAAEPFGCRLKVHSGTYYALEQVIDQIRGTLNNTRRPVDFTGHSLGGMLAQQCALMLHREGYRMGRLVTFGSPPAGNQGFSSAICVAFRRNTFRIVRCGDIVPRFKTMWALGYRHANGLMYIDRKERIWCNDLGDGWSLAERWVDRSLCRLNKHKGPLSVSHHSMVEYDRIVKEHYS